MNTQQRRPFFQAATSNGDRLAKAVPSWKRCFRPCGWIAATLSATLLISCTSLTPDRVNVIAGIAGQAAAEGAEAWLVKHPEHRGAFQAVIDELSAVHRNGNTNEQTLEYAFVERMASLPTDSLRGQYGELYLTSGSTNATRSAQGGLVVWDAHLKKSVAVTGASTRPVLKATLIGLKRAMVPKPPLPPSRSVALPPGVVIKELEGALTLRFTNVISLFTTTPTNALFVRGYGPAYPSTANTNTGPTRVSGLSVASTFDVTLNEHGIQQVNVRWPQATGIFTVQRSEDATAWEGWATVTNAGAWMTLWPAPVAVGQWRAVRR